MDDRKWKITQPPNGRMVEVLSWDEKIQTKAKANYGDDGVRPHWELIGGSCCDPSTFVKWREIENG